MPTSLTAAHRKPPAERVIFEVGFDTGAPLPAVELLAKHLNQSVIQLATVAI
jgi:hypothetical protein